MTTAPDPLDAFCAPTRAWFADAFAAPTAAQAGAWAAIGAGQHALVVAPTGSGKTLAAFLWAIDRLVRPRTGMAHPGRVLYVSPLKALAADVEKNLRSPLAGIRGAALRTGHELPEVTVATRTGDTPQSERRRLATHPPDVLITTPESLFLVLTSAAREGLREVSTVIVDEIHAVAATKRGAHLAVSLERLDALLDRPAQRIGLSATVRPVETVARFLAGTRTPADGGREVSIVQPGSAKQVAVDVVVPVPDLTQLGAPPGSGDQDLTGDAALEPVRASVWPHVEERVVDLVAARRSTIVFTNSRRGAERLTARMNEVWARRAGLDVLDPGAVQPAAVMAQSGASGGADTVFARAHHGSMSRTERLRTESELKSGVLPAVVATSSLELGIDMGAVDLVVQIGCPPSVASGLQRVGRAGHQVDAVSHGALFPTHRGDLIPSAVTAARMRAGQIEQVRLVRNPLDVLAQQIVAMVAVDDWEVAELAALVRTSAPFAELGDGALRAVLDMLSGRYPSEQFGELRARITWDRSADVLRARPGSLRLAVTSGGTIPDRGLYGVFLAGSSAQAPDDGSQQEASSRPRRARGGRRVGELDEEMVYESRVGDTFTLGSSTWRITDITPDRVLVVPAPGLPGRLPFWKGDAPGRPAELGAAIGAWVRALGTDEVVAHERLRAEGLDAWAADNLLAYLREQREATGVVPDDRRIVVERFRDEIGDWRIAVHTPYGSRVHAPWALVLGARLRDRYGVDVGAMHTDDGILLRLPDTGLDAPGQGWADAAVEPSLTTEDLLIDPDEVGAAVRAELGGSVMFAARFREAAARALLLPRRSPDKRQPLWQQRQRGAQLLSVAAQYPEFPIVLEAVRESLQEDFDVAALTDLMTRLADGQVELVHVDTAAPSPFAQSLLFSYTAEYLYDGDAPLAERRAAALTVDPTLLDEILGQQGQSQVADLLDPASIERTEAELTGLVPERAARHAEDVVDLLRRLGPLTTAGVVARTRAEARGDAPGWLEELRAQRRVIAVRLPGLTGTDRDQWAAVEDAGRLRDGLGVALPPGLPDAYTEPVPDPLGDLVLRHARTHGPFAPAHAAARYGTGVAVTAEVLERLAAARLLLVGRLRPESLGGTGLEYCDPDVLRVLRRRSLAALRAEIEPVPQRAVGIFLPRWQQVGELRGRTGLLRAIEQLSGAPVPASDLESQILPARVRDYAPAMLDDLTTSGEVLWAGHSRLPGTGRGAGNGLISLHLAQTAPLTLADPDPAEPEGLAAALLAVLSRGGAFFLDRLTEQLDAEPATQAAVRDALWDLVWSGRVTNDSFGPLRMLVGHRAARAARAPRAMARRRFGVAAIAARAGAAPALQGGGRWAALPPPEPDPTVRLHALTGVVLDRHGIVTRAIAPVEGLSGRFAGVYQVLGALEAGGEVRRGYFVEHLGGSQFAVPGAVDLVRDLSRGAEQRAVRTAPAGATVSVALAATDPANPYGAALAWPTPSTGEDAAPGHRPGRKAGAIVVLVDGDLALYVERGGRTVLTFELGPDVLATACAELVAAARTGRLGRLSITRVDGAEVLGSPSEAVRALLDAGFLSTPRGLRLPVGTHRA